MRESARPSNRTPNQPPEVYWQMLSPEVRASFSEAQATAVQAILTQAAQSQPSPKLVDLRFTVDLVLSRFYVVLLVGKDRRQRQRLYLPDRLTRIGNVIAAVVLLIGLNLLISLLILLFAYLVKSAVGWDLIPGGHLADHLQQLR
ncbi:MAG: hypothetical protein ACKO7W_14365 [Elainella sp.]